MTNCPILRTSAKLMRIKQDEPQHYNQKWIRKKKITPLNFKNITCDAEDLSTIVDDQSVCI